NGFTYGRHFYFYAHKCGVKLLKDLSVDFFSNFYVRLYILLHFLSGGLVLERPATYSELLSNVLLGITSCGAAAFLAGYHLQGNVSVPEFTADIWPCPHVFRFFLYPEKLRCVFVLIA